jgi:oligoendopeptidase F
MTNLAREWNESYLRLHVPKEDLFWSTYMGIADESAALAKAEVALKNYVSDPAQLPKIRDAVSKASNDEERKVLTGWQKFFEANTIENADARQMQGELVELERKLYEKRAAARFEYKNSKGETVPASTNVLSINVSTSKDAVIRKSSYEALLGLEQFVLGNGFLEIVRARNRFAQKLGFQNFFEYKLMRNEGLTVEALDAIFVPFEEKTRGKCFSELVKIAQEKGPESLHPWELLFRTMGDVTADTDPYFPFSKSLGRWGLSFSRLGIRYRGAELTLDLLERPGKYENGFMHGPMPCYFDGDKWVSARINFTSNGTPNQVGNGLRTLMTLFHEGGHAAHFSNVLQPSPSFSQEFPPTSMAFAETQSMFLDSLIRDADWMKRYAKNKKGEPISDELIRRTLVSGQPLRAYSERSMLVVTRFEQ